jgi:hypothetical protein
MYDVEGLMNTVPAETVNARKPWVDVNPTLTDLLRHGTLDELADAVYHDQVPEPWRTIALTSLPTGVLLVRGIRWMKEEG